MRRIGIDRIAYWGLMFLIFMIPFQIYFKLHGSLHASIAQIMVGLLLIGCFLIVKNKRRFELPDAPLNSPVIFLAAVIIVSTLLSTNIFNSAKYAIKWIVLLLLYFIVLLNVKSLKQVEKLIALIVISGLCLAIIGIIEYSFGAKKMLNFVSESPLAPLIMEPSTLESKLARPSSDTFNWYHWYKGIPRLRAFGTFVSVIAFSAYIGLIIPVVIGWVSQKRPLKRRLFWDVGIVLMLCVLVLTFTRSAWLGLGASIAFITLIKGKWKYLLMFCGLIGILLFVNWLIFPGFIITLKGRFFLMFKPTSQIGRITFWSAALKIIKTQPVFGVGLANYKYGFAKYVGDIGLVSHSAHSNYLQIGAEMGLLGLTSFIWIIIVGIQTSWRIFKSTSKDISCWGLGFLGIWIWFVVQSFFSPYFFGNKYSMLFWIVAGLNMCVYRLCKRQIGDKSSE